VDRKAAKKAYNTEELGCNTETNRIEQYLGLSPSGPNVPRPEKKPFVPLDLTLS